MNNGSGLGFGIIGGQQAGVIVKTILPDGVADRDGRLKPNDFILQVRSTSLKLIGRSDLALVNYLWRLPQFGYYVDKMEKYLHL